MLLLLWRWHGRLCHMRMHLLLGWVHLLGHHAACHILVLGLLLGHLATHWLSRGRGSRGPLRIHCLSLHRSLALDRHDDAFGNRLVSREQPVCHYLGPQLGYLRSRQQRGFLITTSWTLIWHWAVYWGRAGIAIRMRGAL